MTPTILDRRCQCGDLLFWSAGVQACAECDAAITWVANDRPRRVSRRDVVEFALIVAACLIPMIVAVRWWWS